jgi:hypothetical protein
VPPAVVADFEQVTAERTALAASHERLSKELDATRARFDADKKRWIELRGGK